MIRRIILAALLLLAVVPTGDAWQIQSAPAVGGCASATEQWNPTYFTGAGTGGAYAVITNGGLTIQSTAAGQNQVITAIGSRCHTTGKYYYEFNPVKRAVGSGEMWGLAALTHLNTTLLGEAIPAIDSIGYNDFSAQKDWRYAGADGTLVGMVVADTNVLGIAVDLTTGRIWIRNVTTSASTWFGADASAADPATNTNGSPFTPFGIPMYIAWSSAQNGSTNEGATLCVSTGCFGAAAPSGFSAWQ